MTLRILCSLGVMLPALLATGFAPLGAQERAEPDLLLRTLAAVVPVMNRNLADGPVLVVPGPASAGDSLDSIATARALGARARIPRKEETLVECTGTAGTPDYGCPFKGGAQRLLISGVQRSGETITVDVSLGSVVRDHRMGSRTAWMSQFADYQVILRRRGTTLEVVTVKLKRMS